MTLEQIRKLRPEFELDGGMRMVEWFEVEILHNWCHIRSGLRPGDGRSISPYYYNHTSTGPMAVKVAIETFSTWWDSRTSTCNMMGFYTGETDKNHEKIYYEVSRLKFPDGTIGKIMFDYGQLAAYYARENNSCIEDLEGVNNNNSFYLRDCEVI